MLKFQIADKEVETRPPPRRSVGMAGGRRDEKIDEEGHARVQSRGLGEICAHDL